MRFFIDFSDFGSILGGPGAPKNCKKSLKIDVGARSERVPACDMILVAFLKRFEGAKRCSQALRNPSKATKQGSSGKVCRVDFGWILKSDFFTYAFFFSF